MKLVPINVDLCDNESPQTDQFNSLRFLLSNAISTNSRPQKSNLSPSQKSSFSELHSAHNLIFTKTDKGGETVVLNKSDYTSHVETMLNSAPYTTLNKAPSTDHLVEVKNNIKNLVLSDQTKLMVIPSVGTVLDSMLFLKFINLSCFLTNCF